MMNLNLKSSTFDNYTIIHLSGKGLAEQDFEPLFETTFELIDQKSPNLIVDLSELKIMNSLGLNALIKIFTKSRNSGGEMYIVNISEKINQVLLLTKLNSVLNIAKSVEDAIKKFE